MRYIRKPRGSCIKLVVSVNYCMGTQIMLPELTAVHTFGIVIYGKKSIVDAAITIL